MGANLGRYRSGRLGEDEVVDCRHRLPLIAENKLANQTSDDHAEPVEECECHCTYPLAIGDRLPGVLANLHVAATKRVCSSGNLSVVELDGV